MDTVKHQQKQICWIWNLKNEMKIWRGHKITFALFFFFWKLFSFIVSKTFFFSCLFLSINFVSKFNRLSIDSALKNAVILKQKKKKTKKHFLLYDYKKKKILTTIRVISFISIFFFSLVTVKFFTTLLCSLVCLKSCTKICHKKKKKTDERTNVKHKEWQNTEVKF